MNSNDTTKLRDFALFMFSEWPDSMPDEFEMQDKALELGLLEKITMDKPCGPYCWCEEYHGEFPVECLRRTDLLLGVSNELNR